MSLQANQRAFLAAYSKTLNIMLSCKEAGVERTISWIWRRDNPEFLEAFKQAEEDFRDYVDARVQARVPKSDLILIFWAKANLPNKYGDRITHELGNTFADFVRRTQQLASQPGGIEIPPIQPPLLLQGSSGAETVEKAAGDTDIDQGSSAHGGKKLHNKRKNRKRG